MTWCLRCDAPLSGGPVLVVPAPPGRRELQSVLVTAERRQVEDSVGPHQLLDAAAVRGVRVVNDAVLFREGAHSLALRLGLINVAEVVLASVPLLLVRESSAEVVPE